MADEAQDATTTEKKAETERITVADFLENVGPSSARHVSDLWYEESSGGRSHRKIVTPAIRIHCESDNCGGVRTFRYKEGQTYFNNEGEINSFLDYVCSNCRKIHKRFSIRAVTKDKNAGIIYKYGEEPAFGPPTPARLIRLFGSDKDLFLKGRRCEIHGLGIGAFVYYRRVVESHKDQIFDAIIKVAKAINFPKEKIETLERAKAENQFTKGIEQVKDAIPESLLINGHNPLTLLHRPLSEHLHSKSDNDCLELAEAIRVVLVELAEKIGAALNEQIELNKAVTRLLAKQ